MKIPFVLLGIVILLALAWIVTRRSNYQPSIQPTFTGDPFSYEGDKKLIVAVYASWAPVWKATEAELAKLDLSKYDLRLVSADHETGLSKRLGTKIVPTVFLFEDGKIVKTLPNLMQINELQ